METVHCQTDPTIVPHKRLPADRAFVAVSKFLGCRDRSLPSRSLYTITKSAKRTSDQTVEKDYTSMYTEVTLHIELT